jgi:hypothetical protein
VYGCDKRTTIRYRTTPSKIVDDIYLDVIRLIIRYKISPDHYHADDGSSVNSIGADDPRPVVDYDIRSYRAERLMSCGLRK